MMIVTKDIKREIAEKGFCLIPDTVPAFVQSIVKELGEIMFETDIIEKESGRLINTSKEMFFHTDHPFCHYLVWHCIKQADQGGETRLLSIPQLLETLPEEHQNTLKEIQLKLSLEFDDGNYPFYKEGHFFYSPSLLLSNYTIEEQIAIAAFKTAIHLFQPVVIRMNDNDMLIIDNQRLMHSRGAFTAGTDRHLKRYLIKTYN